MRCIWNGTFVLGLGLTVAVVVAGLAPPSAGQAGPGWTILVDDKTMGEWNKVGETNWRMEDGALVADKRTSQDPAYLVSKEKYKDFQIQAEFWADEDVNSGIFIRCKSATVINAKDCYEVNIFDKRPDPSYGTGAIVDVAKVVPMPKAAGKWNTYDITAKGDHLVVIFNGQKTVDVTDKQLLEAGPIALQYGSGVLKWRKVQIRSL